ncbi:Glycosyltransferase, catalytic subunit of cellulose synthase and poly-beta-1,6-N-acetylglucosamine synthase [Agrococcus baldri]|uniref:Glycosyltransferase, catalytic subunit of cellulose synthase and poly-beta-1,6-N-acetylglucosamine synthase n=1 Tax=Agrococcus baldri TaxID=153730 RepID=A0AA94KZ13_9MICO|nr:glycosyltransferase family 2 protein [Agrococcus baldri]SFS06690.1 Glycosyltransferase, catalytic subunit of cellulose synthase and poly-beta-1,6-N-acetylglucosamine synthase [Agrococcus baldri]
MSWLHDIVSAIILALAWPSAIYFLLSNTAMLVLVLMASRHFVRHLRESDHTGREAMAASPLSPGVSVLVPAYNEAAVIRTSVRSVLDLRYPDHEVIVVNDGSTDATMQVLRDEFDLVPDDREIPGRLPVRGAIVAVWRSRGGVVPLIVVDTLNSGRSDSINAALDLASKDLVVMVDADSILEPDALLSVSKPFADDPDRVVATGGAIRIVNNSRVLGGRIVEIRMPKQLIARIQVVEYLRAFMLGRTAWSDLQALVLISGAFGMFRRDVLLEVGGLDPDSIGEDFELVMRMQRWIRDGGRDKRIVYVPEPVSWTEAPSTLQVLARQRRRWHRGLWEVLWKYRGMLLRPRYGRIGAVALPYYWLFELFAPLLEILGLVLIVLGFATGALNTGMAVFLILVSYGYGTLVTLTAVVVEEASFHRYERWRDLGATLWAVLAESLGYRQLTAVWRLQGWWAGLTGRTQVWGEMTRAGFAGATDASGRAGEAEGRG